ncbi:carbohydrate kinase family protein [Mycolicibacterium sp. J2]|uniref:carbohydrate kinase family protein n=1 Tax=Mycolicibacterium sp. J2 TaxID=2993511 RepID=UPI00224AAD3B|nr:carbohydrate kinase family protein [Mycolicibacterium sp. J2]MCX2713185.1 carbohydrate kinase family protein [Mycolicibacterium sp. J2]
MKVITMGAHILDVLVRPVDAIPDGQQTALVEDIRVTAAGTAAGTALTLAKLGATVRTAGAIGADATGELLLALLGRAGVDTTLVVRKPELPTSMSVLPIRGNGERPSLHLLGANPGYTLDDVDWDAVAETDHLHLGGPELIGAESAARILLHAKANGATTSIDLIAPGALGTLDAIAAALPHCDYLLPNAEQVIGFTGAVDLTEGAHILLDAGVGMIAATDGADGAVLFEGRTSRHIPAHDVPVIDTTGCGDAFSAGFLYAMGVGRPPVAAVQLGTAVAALVAQGLGSDHGDFTLDTADAFAAAAPTRPSGS